MLLKLGGGLIGPTPSRKPKITFDFLKVHNEFGKVTQFGTSKPPCSWRNSNPKEVQVQSTPHQLKLHPEAPTIRVNIRDVLFEYYRTVVPFC